MRSGHSAWSCSTANATLVTSRRATSGASSAISPETEKDSLFCLEQAHAALTFVYHDVLGLAVGELPCPEPPRLLDRLRRACRVRQFSPRTEDCYATWAERFIRFHGLRHPNTMGAPSEAMGG